MNALEARAQALETQKARWMKLHIDVICTIMPTL